MTAEQSVFLALLRDHVHGTHTASVPPDLGWDKLQEIAQQQSLAGLCYAQLCDSAGVPAEALESFHQDFYGAVYLDANRKAAFREIAEAFRAAEIECLPFKGFVVKDYWPVPELRSMGDIDLLIHPEDRKRSDGIMRKLGYDCFVDNHAVWTYTADKLMFELHDHMFYEPLANAVDYRGYFDRAWAFYDQGWNENYHFLYLITHLAKHILNNGMGFRSFLDLVFMCQHSKKPLDWDWICAELEKLQLLAFTRICFALCQSWFAFEPPIPVPELEAGFYADCTEKMFRDGTFGLENEQNEGAHAAKEIKRSRGPYWLGAISVAIRRIFPPYEDMQLIPWYSFVDGRPWLLPFAWVYRWVYCLIHKRSQSEALLTETFLQRREIEERQSYIQNWGL